MPHQKSERIQLIEATGQNGIPSLVDSETKTVVKDDDDKIIEYLEKKFLNKKTEHRITKGASCPILR